MTDPSPHERARLVRELRRTAAVVGLIAVLLAVLPVGRIVPLRLAFAVVLGVAAIVVAWSSVRSPETLGRSDDRVRRAGVLVMLPVTAALLVLALVLI